MADILERIHHPILRAVTAAVMGAAAVTVITSGILGLTRAEKAWIHRLSISGGAAGAVLGALWGGVGVKPADTRRASKPAADRGNPSATQPAQRSPAPSQEQDHP